MKRIVVVGSINTDLVVRVRHFPHPGETIVGSSFDTYAGGKGANQAAAAARVGGQVSMTGAVGDDPYSRERLHDLRDAGVNVDGILQRANTPGGIAVIQIDATGENQITIVAGANGTVSPDDVRDRLCSELTPDDLVCAQLELPLETVRTALEVARDVGARTVVNTAPIIDDADQLLELIDVLVVNEIEAGQLLGRPPVAVEAAEDAARALLELGPQVVLITLGKSGAVACNAEACYAVRAPHVDVVDTTGAGDAAVGAFAAATAEEKPLDEAVQFAVAAGSFTVQRPGAQPSQPTRRELEEFIAAHT